MEIRECPCFFDCVGDCEVCFNAKTKKEEERRDRTGQNSGR